MRIEFVLKCCQLRYVTQSLRKTISEPDCVESVTAPKEFGATLRKQEKAVKGSCSSRRCLSSDGEKSVQKIWLLSSKNAKEKAGHMILPSSVDLEPAKSGIVRRYMLISLDLKDEPDTRIHSPI